jgi:hypothetical protein
MRPVTAEKEAYKKHEAWVAVLLDKCCCMSCWQLLWCFVGFQQQRRGLLKARGVSGSAAELQCCCIMRPACHCWLAAERRGLSEARGLSGSAAACHARGCRGVLLYLFGFQQLEGGLGKARGVSSSAADLPNMSCSSRTYITSSNRCLEPERRDSGASAGSCALLFEGMLGVCSNI